MPSKTISAPIDWIEITPGGASGPGDEAGIYLINKTTPDLNFYYLDFTKAQELVDLMLKGDIKITYEDTISRPKVIKRRMDKNVSAARLYSNTEYFFSVTKYETAVVPSSKKKTEFTEE